MTTLEERNVMGGDNIVPPLALGWYAPSTHHAGAAAAGHMVRRTPCSISIWYGRKCNRCLISYKNDAYLWLVMMADGAASIG